MKIKNSNLKGVNMALFSLGNHQGNIQDRWEITKYAKPFADAVGLLDMQIQMLVNEKGVEKDGQKTLSTENDDYKKLMQLDIEIAANQLKLQDIEKYNPTTQELMNLIPIIQEE